MDLYPNPPFHQHSIFPLFIALKETLAGKVFNYYRSIGVASIKVSGELEVGSFIRIKGHTTNFDQRVESLQIRGEQVFRASKGDTVGMKVIDYVRKHDCVYRLE